MTTDAASGPLPLARVRAVLSAQVDSLFAITSQGLSSFTNALALVVAARVADPVAFGHVALAATTLTLLIGLCVAFDVQPALTGLRRSERSPALRAAARSITALAIVPAVLIIGDGQIGLWLISLAALPALTLVQGRRVELLGLGQARIAALLDALWLGIFVAALMIRSADLTAIEVWIHWLASGAVVALVSLLFSQRDDVGSVERSGAVRAGRSLAVAFVATAGLTQASFLLGAAFAGPEFAGTVRGLLLFLSPVNIVFAAFMPRLLRRLTLERLRGNDIVPLALRLSLVFTIIAGGAAGFLVLLPDAIGVRVLGETWPSVAELTIPFGIYAVGALGLSAGPPLLLQAEHRFVELTWVRIIVGTMLGAAGVLGSVIAGAQGYVWALAATAPLLALCYWLVAIGRRTESAEAGPPLGQAS